MISRLTSLELCLLVAMMFPFELVTVLFNYEQKLRRHIKICHLRSFIGQAVISFRSRPAYQQLGLGATAQTTHVTRKTSRGKTDVIGYRCLSDRLLILNHMVC